MSEHNRFAHLEVHQPQALAVVGGVVPYAGYRHVTRDVLDGPIGAVQRALEAQRVPGSDLRRQVVHTVAWTPAAGYLGDVAVRVSYLAEQSEAGQTRELSRGHGQL